MKSSISGVRWRWQPTCATGSLLLWFTVLVLCSSVIQVNSVDTQSVDVEPAILKKEQPDFEDDTGPVGGVGVGSALRESLGDAVNRADKPGVPNINMPAVHSPVPDARVKDADIINPSVAEMDVSFMHAFVASLCIIIVSELGDKTFFISAIMAMSHPRLTVFVGAMTALAGMHVMSAMFGYVITFIPRMYTFYISSALFAFFGLKMIKEGWFMSSDEGREELEEVQTDLRKRDDNFEREPLEEGGAGQKRGGGRNRVMSLVSRVFIQAFTLNVLAEWGDRSQIATVIMAAREDVYGVIVGGLIGHFVCTGLAVLGGRMIASWISVRTVTLIGGVVFILFAVSALVVGP